jgi:hypothetical protein
MDGLVPEEEDMPATPNKPNATTPIKNFLGEKLIRTLKVMLESIAKV